MQLEHKNVEKLVLFKLGFLLLALVGTIYGEFNGGFLNVSLFFYLPLYSQAYQPG